MMFKTMRFAMLVVAVSSFASIPRQASAQGADLAGAWSGGGTVIIAGGNRERARCRVRYTAQSATTYMLTGSCATDTTRVDQTATLKKTGPNTYAGTFQNTDFNVSGTIKVTVNGNSQTATLSSDSGSAVLALKRQ